MLTIFVSGYCRYVLGDQAIAKAIALDKQHGISDKFLNYFKKIETKFKVSGVSMVLFIYQPCPTS